MISLRTYNKYSHLNSLAINNSVVYSVHHDPADCSNAQDLYIILPYIHEHVRQLISRIYLGLRETRPIMHNFFSLFMFNTWLKQPTIQDE